MGTKSWATLCASGSEVTASPFLKWAGGKKQLLSAITPYIESTLLEGKYIEPFLGGGAVFFSLKPKSAILGDRNEALIRTYRTVKDRCEELIPKLEALPRRTTKAEYVHLRHEYNQLQAANGALTRERELKLSALFIWLNHQCFNGLYRVNQAGEFNVPFGRYVHPSIYSEDSLRAASRALRRAGAVLMASDFEQTLELAAPGDVIYLDPPYVPISLTSSFTSYTERGFGARDQVRLANLVHQLAGRGVHVVLSNSSTESARSLYADMTQVQVSARRAINCVGSKRGQVAELVVLSDGVTVT